MVKEKGATLRRTSLLKQMILLILLGQLPLNPKSDETGDHDPAEYGKANPDKRSPELDLSIAFHERQFCRTDQ